MPNIPGFKQGSRPVANGYKTEVCLDSAQQTGVPYLPWIMFSLLKPVKGEVIGARSNNFKEKIYSKVKTFPRFCVCMCGSGYQPVILIVPNSRECHDLIKNYVSYWQQKELCPFAKECQSARSQQGKSTLLTENANCAFRQPAECKPTHLRCTELNCISPVSLTCLAPDFQDQQD